METDTEKQLRYILENDPLGVLRDLTPEEEQYIKDNPGIQDADSAEDAEISLDKIRAQLIAAQEELGESARPKNEKEGVTKSAKR